MKRILSSWFIVIFLGVLTVPVWGWFIDSKIELSGVSASPQKVEASVKSVGEGEFQTYLNALWEDSFPGKKALLTLRNQLLYSVFNVSPNNNIVLGKNKNLFETRYILLETQIIPPSSEEYFDNLGSDLGKLRDILETNGKELYVFITPSKAHFCKDQISKQYLLLDNEEEYDYTNYMKLVATLDNNGIYYFDSVEYIEQNIDNDILKAPLFYSTGIHWSQPWGERCACEFLDYMDENSKYNFPKVSSREIKSDEIVNPATDLYSTLNLIQKPKGEWWASEIQVVEQGTDKPNIFFRGGSFMGQSISSLIMSDVFGDDVHFENNYYFLNKYSETYNLSAFDAYDEIDLDRLVGQSDILVLEVNEGTIDMMSWRFIEYLLDNQEILDHEYYEKNALELEEYFREKEAQIIGAQKTENNPWGVTAGKIEFEKNENSVLLTPDTAICFNKLQSENELRFIAQIHPLVSDGSDGVGLQVTAYDENGAEQMNYEITIDSQEVKEQLIEIPLNTGRLDLKCNCGANSDYTSDWLVLSFE